jgi:hypothetical protein
VGLVVYYYLHEKGLYLTAVPVNRPVLKAVNLARPPRRRSGRRSSCGAGRLNRAFLTPRRVGARLPRGRALEAVPRGPLGAAQCNT